MDMAKLKKKISSYRTPKGRITRLPDELLGEMLYAWEQWSGPSGGFYKELGVDYRKMASLMGRAKQLKREGAFDGVEFTEVELETEGEAIASPSAPSSGCGIELVWQDQVIRFGNSELLLDFLKKAA